MMTTNPQVECLKCAPFRTIDRFKSRRVLGPNFFNPCPRCGAPVTLSSNNTRAQRKAVREFARAYLQ